MAGGVPQRLVQQAPTPLFADVARSAPPPTPQQLTTQPITTVPITLQTTPAITPLPPATPPTPAAAPPVNPISTPQPPKKRRDWRKLLLIVSFSTLFVLFIGAGALIYEAVRNSDNKDPVNSQVASTSIPLSEFAGSGSLNLLGTQSLAVNGQLRANESFVLAPQAQPSKFERGQLYFDSNTNRLAYYNGSSFVQIPGDEQSVLTLQGQSGNITLVGGTGLAVNGTTLTNTGVTSLGGAAGDITLGSGVTIVDGGLTNTGVVGATGGTGITVTNDGAGTITISNTSGGTGTVTSPNGTPGRIAKFTGVQTIEDSLLSETGSAVTVNGDVSVTGTTTLATALGVNSGGTGAASFTANGVIIGNGSGALTAVAAGGPGECLVSTGGAPNFQACPGSGGVTALNGLNGAITIANAGASGSTITINDASTSQKGIAQFNSTNFTVTSGTVNTIQDINVAAAPTFGRLTVTSSQASNAMLLTNNTNAGASGNLLDVQLNGASRLSVNPAGNMTLVGTVNGQTISSAANLTGTLAVAGAANLNGGATVTGTLAANTITPSGALTVGATTQSFLVQGNDSSTITATNGANTTTVAFQTPTANVTYRLLTAAAGTYDLCTTVGNCASVGGGVTTSGGTPNRLAKFTGSQVINDSIITDNGTTVTIGGTLSVNTVTPSAAMTIGATSQNLTLQGATTSLSSTSSGFTNSLTFATPAGSNKIITLPNATGTVAVSASGPLSMDSNGNITCATCVTSGGGSGGVAAVDSLNGLTGTLTIANATTAGSTITLNDASTSQKGIAQFNSTNFSAASGVINTIQNIHTTAAPTFGQLTLTSSQASAAMLTVNNTNVSATGNLIDLQLNGSSRMTVNPAGAMTLSSTINGQTISSAANFTGTLAVTGAANLNGGASLAGGLQGTTAIFGSTNALTLGTTGSATGAILFKGSTAASGTITIVGPNNPSDNTITIPNGTGTICISSGNCSGVGSTNTLQAAYDAGNTITATTARDISFTLSDQATDPNFLVNLECDTSCSTNGRFAIQDDGTDVATVSPGGATLFQNTVNSNFAFEVRTAATDGLLRVDTSARRVAIGAYNPAAADNITGQLQVLPTSAGRQGINITSPAGYGANYIEAMDNVGTTMFRVQFNGAVTTALGVYTSNPQTAASTNSSGSTFGSGAVSGTTSDSGATTLKSGNSTTSGNSGAVTVVSGNATSGNSGATTLDVGTASGTAGQVYVGTSNASAVNIGRSGINTTVSGTLGASGNVNISGALSANSAGVTTNLNVTGTTSSGALSVTNDANVGGSNYVTGSVVSNTITSLAAMTVGNAAQTLNIQGTTTTITSGSTIVKPTGTSTAAFQVQNSGSTPLLTVNGSTNNVSVANKLTTGSFDGAGLADCDATNSKLLWDATTSQFSCGTDRASVTIRKSADELVTSSTTLQNDDELTFSIGANETYIVHMSVNATMSASGSIKYTVTAPSGATCNIGSMGGDATGASAEITNGACSTTGAYGGGGTASLQTIDVTITNGMATGNVTLQWAQNASSGTATRVKAGSSLVAYKITGADLAEAYYTNNASISSGDVVSLDPESAAGVNKSAKVYDTKAIGVISTRPGHVLADPEAGTATGRPVLVALSGRIPVKVSTGNGAIHAGDFLTTSATPGVAMKATRPGQVIGRALEGYSGSSQGLILMFASQQWADPRDPDGEQLQSDLLQASLMEVATLTADTVAIRDLTVKNRAIFLGDVVVHGNTSVVSLTVNGHVITGGDTPTAKAGSGACDGATATVEGTDTAGRVTVTPPAGCDTTGGIVTVTFSKAFDKPPRVTLTPANANASMLKTYVDSDAITTTSFTIATPTAVDGSRTYKWHYQVLQ